MDTIDKKILTELQRDSRVSNQALAEKVALSPSPCLRRVKMLEENNIIQGYVALLNAEKLGLALTVMVGVGLDSHDANIMSEFERKITTIPEVVHCYLITGQTADYLLKVIVRDIDQYQHFLLDKLTKIKGVGNVYSSFVLRKNINKSSLPLEYAMLDD